MKPLAAIALTLSLSTCTAPPQTWSPPKLNKEMMAWVPSYYATKFAFVAAAVEYAVKTDIGITDNQMEGIWQSIRVYWLPHPWQCLHNDGTCTGDVWYDEEDQTWIVRVMLRQCVADTALVHEFLHLLMWEFQERLLTR